MNSGNVLFQEQGWLMEAVTCVVNGTRILLTPRKLTNKIIGIGKFEVQQEVLKRLVHQNLEFINQFLSLFQAKNNENSNSNVQLFASFFGIGTPLNPNDPNLPSVLSELGVRSGKFIGYIYTTFSIKTFIC